MTKQVGNILLVKVPNGAMNLIIVKDQLRYKTNPLKYWWDLIKLPPGDWQLLRSCTADQLTEEDIAELENEAAVVIYPDTNLQSFIRHHGFEPETTVVLFNPNKRP